jgi:uncharacterized protein YjbI with pentapeptide repeats
MSKLMLAKIKLLLISPLQSDKLSLSTTIKRSPFPGFLKIVLKAMTPISIGIVASLVAGWVFSVQMENLNNFNSKLTKLTDDNQASYLSDKEKLQFRKDLIAIEKDEVNLKSNIYFNLIQNLGGMFFLVTSYFAWRNLIVAQANLKVTEEKQLTDRLAKAFENLDSESTSLKLGAIYTLKRIASESSEECQFIWDILDAFIRKNSSSNHLSSTELRLALKILVELSRQLKIENFSRQPPTNSSGLYLFGANLKNLDFRRSVFLQNADLQESVLDGANLSGADLRGANLSRSYLGTVNLTASDLSNATLCNVNETNNIIKPVDFSDSVLYRSDLTNAQLFRANFTRSDLGSVIMEGADLREATFCYARLASADFRNADLSHTNFDGADMANVKLDGADLFEAMLTNTKISDIESLRRAKNWESSNFTKARLFQADFTGAALPSINMSGAYLREAKFCNADLNSADFRNADLRKVNFDGATITDIKLDGANLAEAVLTNIQIADVEVIKRSNNWKEAEYNQSIRQKLGL